MDSGENMDWEIDRFRRGLSHVGIRTFQNEDQNVAYDGFSWEILPKDIMENIVLHLNSTDYIHSSMVCKSWQSLLLQSDILRPQIPWLLLPHHSTRHKIKFYNVLEDKYHTFILPKGVVGGSVVGCSKGWVIFMTKPRYTISLLNPISGAWYLLPWLPTTSPLQRVELSSSNISNCIVAAIFNNFKKLALCKLGDERWEVLPISRGFGRNRRALIDVLFCRQKLHVLINSETSNAGRIENFIVNKLPNNGKAISITLIHDMTYTNSGLFEVDEIPPFFGFKVFSRHLHISYLVESIKGQAMLIQKHYSSFFVRQKEQVDMIHEFFDINNSDIDEEEEDDNDNGYHERRKRGGNGTILKHVLSELDGFKIYEIEDLAANKRVCRGLGKEQALFLSSKSRLCLPNIASNKLQGNCIHFIMDRANVGDGHEPYLIDINGIYHLDNLTLQTLIPKFEYLWNSEFLWFAPNL